MPMSILQLRDLGCAGASMTASTEAPSSATLPAGRRTLLENAGRLDMRQRLRDGELVNRTAYTAIDCSPERFRPRALRGENLTSHFQSSIEPAAQDDFPATVN